MFGVGGVAQLGEHQVRNLGVRGSIPLVSTIFYFCVGMWHSLVARIVRDDEAAGSNPVIPTICLDIGGRKIISEVWLCVNSCDVKSKENFRFYNKSCGVPFKRQPQFFGSFNGYMLNVVVWH